MSNTNFDDIINGMKKQGSKKEAQEYLMRNLSPDQSRKVNEVLSDRKKLEEMLSTKEAKEIFKKLTEGGNG